MSKINTQMPQQQTCPLNVSTIDTNASTSYQTIASDAGDTPMNLQPPKPSTMSPSLVKTHLVPTDQSVARTPITVSSVNEGPSTLTFDVSSIMGQASDTGISSTIHELIEKTQTGTSADENLGLALTVPADTSATCPIIPAAKENTLVVPYTKPNVSDETCPRNVTSGIASISSRVFSVLNTAAHMLLRKEILIPIAAITIATIAYKILSKPAQTPEETEGKDPTTAPTIKSVGSSTMARIATIFKQAQSAA